MKCNTTHTHLLLHHATSETNIWKMTSLTSISLFWMRVKHSSWFVKFTLMQMQLPLCRQLWSDCVLTFTLIQYFHQMTSQADTRVYIVNGCFLIKASCYYSNQNHTTRRAVLQVKPIVVCLLVQVPDIKCLWLCHDTTTNDNRKLHLFHRITAKKTFSK